MENYDPLKDLIERVEKLEKGGCPPHSLVDYAYVGAWASTEPPPNKRCAKCLNTYRF